MVNFSNQERISSLNLSPLPESSYQSNYSDLNQFVVESKTNGVLSPKSQDANAMYRKTIDDTDLDINSYLNDVFNQFEKRA